MNDHLGKILVVDDDDSMRITLEAIIEDEGYDVIGVRDGYEAIKAVQKRNYDLVFMDIKMPGINGVETYREIKKANPGSVVVMMTGFSVEELVKEALQEGAYGVIYKPYSMEQVIDIMKDVLETTAILVVDDLKNHRATLCGILEDTGYKVTEAENGEHAISMVQKNRHDVILMDIEMPGFDGFATFKEIQKIEPRVKVIFVTGYALSESVRQSLQEGAFSVLTKPIDPDNLFTLIKSITGEQASRPRPIIDERVSR